MDQSLCYTFVTQDDESTLWDKISQVVNDYLHERIDYRFDIYQLTSVYRFIRAHHAFIPDCKYHANIYQLYRIYNTIVHATIKVPSAQMRSQNDSFAVCG